MCVLAEGGLTLLGAWCQQGRRLLWSQQAQQPALRLRLQTPPPLPPLVQGGAERQQASKITDRILAATADDVVDMSRAIGKFEAEAREDRHRMKMKVGGAAGLRGGSAEVSTSGHN